MLNDKGGDGLGMNPRPGEPDSVMMAGMGAVDPAKVTPDPFVDPAEGPIPWYYFFDPVNGWTAEFDGVVIAPKLVPPSGFAPLNSPAFTGTPTAPTNANPADNSTQIATDAFVQAANAIDPEPGIFGLNCSTPGSSTNFTVNKGSVADSTFVAQIQLTANLTKTQAAWAAGTGVGGLDTGAIANSTWYHWFVIRNPTTGATDVLFSLSPIAPTMPAGFTQFRRIASMKTTVGGFWNSFVQDGNQFMLANPVNDVSAANPGTAAVTRTLSVPIGIRVQWLGNTGVIDTTTNTAGQGMIAVYCSDLQVNDVAPAGGTTPFSIYTASGATSSGFQYGGVSAVMTNTSGQIRTRAAGSNATTTLVMNTLGWNDFRGQNSIP